jgi:predicted transcriptional regulator
MASSKAAEIVTEVSSKDPVVGLRAAASLRALLESVEELQVKNAREQGWSWERIATALGVSKQAVHQKYGKGTRRTRRRRV